MLWSLWYWYYAIAFHSLIKVYSLCHTLIVLNLSDRILDYSACTIIISNIKRNSLFFKVNISYYWCLMNFQQCFGYTVLVWMVLNTTFNSIFVARTIAIARVNISTHRRQHMFNNWQNVQSNVIWCTENKYGHKLHEAIEYCSLFYHCFRSLLVTDQAFWNWNGNSIIQNFGLVSCLPKKI